MEQLEQIAKRTNLSHGGRKKSHDIYESLRQYVTGNGDVTKTLPSIAKLSKAFNANYRTIKAALNKLAEDGLIVYEQNVGVVVSGENKQEAQPAVKNAIAYARWEGDAFCTTICDGIRRFCNQEDVGIDLVILDAMKSHQRLLDGLISVSELVDGILLMPFDMSEYHNEIQELVDQGTEMVFLDRTVSGMDRVSSVACDDFGGAFQVVSHLLDTHKRPVFYLGQTDAPSSVRNRYLGWQEAMCQHGYMDTERYCAQISSREHELSSSRALALSKTIECAMSVFDRHRADVYCIFGCNDYVAAAAYRAAANCNLKVGRNVFVAGFGNIPLAQNSNPSLTTVEQNPEMMGYEGAKILYDKVFNHIRRPINCILPVNMIVRQSSLPG